MKSLAFANHILNSAQIEDKLIKYDALSNEEQINQFHIPAKPARSKALSFNAKESVKFPSLVQLDQEKYRGILFHFFANHELLALELMALMLLRFPDMDHTYRDGLIHIMQDEQRHLKLYIDQMNIYGIQFGDVGLNDFFWRSISAVDSIYAFTAAMSMTFEQANLDFCRHFLTAFETIEDTQSKNILKRVYQDEIKHVKHGYDYFVSQKDTTQSDWDAYVDALKFPLTPRRGRGTHFDREARETIGFSKEFIDNIELFAHSRGKTPDVYFFNPLADYEHHQKTLPKSYYSLETDLESLLLFFCSEDDILVTRQSISKQFLKTLKAIKIPIPEHITLSSLSHLYQRKCQQFRPWAYYGEHLDKFKPIPFTKPLLRGIDPNLFSKQFALEMANSIVTSFDASWLIPEEDLGIRYNSESDLNAIQQDTQHTKWVIKPNQGSSGNHFIFLDSDQRHLNRSPDFKGVLQPWLNRTLDFSVQFEKKNGNMEFIGMVRNIIDQKGRFKGTLIGSVKHVFDAEHVRFLMYKENGLSRIDRIIETIKSKIKPKLDHIESCSFGIDMLCYTSEHTLRLYPFVEMNPRLTMGRVSLEIKKHMHKDSVGYWRIYSKHDLKRYNYASINDFIQGCEHQFPFTSKNNAIESGLLITSDVFKATQFYSFICIDTQYDQLKNKLKSIGIDLTI